MMTRWYIMSEGRVPGVYDKWEDCFKQVNKFKSNNYKGFKTREEAEVRYNNYRRGREGQSRMKTWFIITSVLLMFLLIVYVMVL
jgi:viroplasmin and RNaseH domain-containing protein